MVMRKYWYFPAMAIITVGLCAQIPPTGQDLPSDQQVIAFLTDSVEWYHHCVIERQLVTNPIDVMFQEDNRAGAVQILELSFDFARAEVLAGTASADIRKRPTNLSGVPELTELVQLENKTEAQSLEASEEIDVINQKLGKAHGDGRRELEAALAAAQSRLEILQAGLSTLEQLVAFMQASTSREAGDLASTIDVLARTVPEVTSTSTVATESQISDPVLSAKWVDSGILALSSEVSVLARKLSILDDEIRRTDKLWESSDQLRKPLLAAIDRHLPALADNALQAKDLAELQQQKIKLDELAALLKALSPAVMALDKQRVLLTGYISHLKSWRAAVVEEGEKTWKRLILRLLGAAALIGTLVLIGAVVRRITRRHVHAADGRHVALVLQRVVLWFTIVIVAAFACAPDLTSLATFFGLLAAGLAVALQSFILSAVGYFVLVGRRGIRIGDRVQISGVSGEVSDIGWLQFQLREIDTRTQQPTGNVVTFSNSIVLASPSTGLSKFNGQSGTPVQVAMQH